MNEVKIFAMNDCDWMAGYDLESVTLAYAKLFDCSGEVDDPHELTAEEMDRFRFDDGDTEDMDEWPTFTEALAKLVADGQKFPCFFASTEY